MPNKNPLFVGRDEQLKKLENILYYKKENEIEKEIEELSKDLEKVVVIFGGGGTGKSSLAWKFAQEKKKTQQYQYIFWISCESLFTSFKVVAKKIGILFNEISEEELVENVYAFLKGKKTLLIFDNADDGYQKLKAYLPDFSENDTLHILMTTQSEYWPHNFSKIPLDVFSKEESREFFKKKDYFNKESSEKIDKLSSKELLGYLPLALNQAAAYIEESKINIDQYIKLFSNVKNAKKLLDYQSQLDDKSSKTILSTFSITLKKIEAEEISHDIQSVLLFCAYCVADNIPEALLIKWIEKITQEDIEAEILFNSVIQILEKYSLITVSKNDEEKRIISLHRLVQKVILLYYKELEQIELIRFIVDQLPISLFDENNSWHYFSAVLPHATNIFESNKNNKKNLPALENLVFKLGLSEDWVNANFSKAVEYFDQAIEWHKKINIDTENDLKFSSHLIELFRSKGSSLLKMGDFKQSSECQEICLKNIKEIGEENISFSTLYSLYHQIGIVNCKKNYFKTGINFYKKSLEYANKIKDGTKEIRQAVILFEIGMVFFEEDKSKKSLDLAKKLYNLSLKLIESIFSDSSFYLITDCYLYLGRVATTERNYQDANEYYQKSLIMMNKCYGTLPHSDFVCVYISLAELNYHVKDLEKCKEYLNSALEIQKLHKGEVSAKRIKFINDALQDHDSFSDSKSKENERYFVIHIKNSLDVSNEVIEGDKASKFNQANQYFKTVLIRNKMNLWSNHRLKLEKNNDEEKHEKKKFNKF